MIIRRIECKESRASNIVNPNAYDKIDTYLRSVRTWTIDCLTTWLTRCLYSMMTTGLPEGTWIT